MINQNTMSKVCSEIYDYLNILGEEFIKNIPKDLYKKLEENRDLSYISKYDESIGLTNDTYSNDAINFILMLDLKYWCTKVERINKISIYEKKEKEYQKELRKKFNQDDIFKSSEKTNIQFNPINMGLIEYKKIGL